MNLWQKELDDEAISLETAMDELYERKAIQAIERRQGYIVSSPLGDLEDFDNRVPLTPAEQAQADWTNGPDGPCIIKWAGCRVTTEPSFERKARLNESKAYRWSADDDITWNDIARANAESIRRDTGDILDYDTSYLDTDTDIYSADREDIEAERPTARKARTAVAQDGEPNPR